MIRTVPTKKSSPYTHLSRERRADQLAELPRKRHTPRSTLSLQDLNNVAAGRAAARDTYPSHAEHPIS